MQHLSHYMLLGCTLLLSACGGDSEMEADFIKTTATKTVTITNEQGAPGCSVQIELDCAQQSLGEKATNINNAVVKRILDMDSLTMQQAVDSFANSYTRNYQENFAPLYREDRNDPDKRSWYEYHYNINGTARAGRDGVIVYNAVIDYYEGGVHGIHQQLILNFDRQTGRQLSLADVFVPGYVQPLNSILLKALLEKTGTKTADELRNKGYLYARDMFAPENFALDKEAVSFIYNSYEIAPYSEGLIELTIPYSDLEDILKK